MEITKNTPKAEVIKLGSECKKCGHCCKNGAGFAQEDELLTIANHLGISEKQLKENYFEKIEVFHKKVHRPKLRKNDGLPFGHCIFLKGTECKIHEVKPLHCKVGNCGENGEQLSEWYTANHLVDKDDPQSIREWATRIKVKPTIKGAYPQDLVGDKKKLKNILNYKTLR